MSATTLRAGAFVHGCKHFCFVHANFIRWLLEAAASTQSATALFVKHDGVIWALDARGAAALVLGLAVVVERKDVWVDAALLWATARGVERVAARTALEDGQTEGRGAKTRGAVQLAARGATLAVVRVELAATVGERVAEIPVVGVGGVGVVEVVVHRVVVCYLFCIACSEFVCMHRNFFYCDWHHRQTNRLKQCRA